MNTYVNYLPKQLAQFDQEQPKVEPKPLTDEQKQEIVDRKTKRAEQITSEYNVLFEKYRTQYIDNIINNALKKYKQQSIGIGNQLEELDKNKPMFWEKELGRKTARPHERISDNSAFV